MIGQMLRVMMESPVLMLVLIADLFLIGLIVYYIVTKVLGKKRPDLKLRSFFSRFFVRFKAGEMKTIEPLYEYVVHRYLRQGVVSSDMGKGLKAREKILESLEDEEKNVVKSIFDSYESKKYGGGVWNEEKTVADLLTQFRSI